MTRIMMSMRPSDMIYLRCSDYKSREQHRKSRALVVIVLTNLHCTADPADKRLNYSHPHALAGGWIKTLRQTCTVIADRECIALSRILLQPDRDPTFAVLGGVRDQFIDDEAERNGGS